MGSFILGVSIWLGFALCLDMLLMWFVLCSVQASVCYVSLVYLSTILCLRFVSKTCLCEWLVVVCYFLFTFLFNLPWFFSSIFYSPCPWVDLYWEKNAKFMLSLSLSSLRDRIMAYYEDYEDLSFPDFNEFTRQFEKEDEFTLQFESLQFEKEEKGKGKIWSQYRLDHTLVVLILQQQILR